jgi:hypothetical protein
MLLRWQPLRIGNKDPTTDGAVNGRRRMDVLSSAIYLHFESETLTYSGSLGTSRRGVGINMSSERGASINPRNFPLFWLPRFMTTSQNE